MILPCIFDQLKEEDRILLMEYKLILNSVNKNCLWVYIE